jgi:dTDP-4-amino-4,6-dideoxygalactose transaminase
MRIKKNVNIPNVNVPFNLPHVGNEELTNIIKAHALGQLSGDGYFTKECNLWIEKKLNAKKALLTQSCTAALEMIALLSKVGIKDEVIMPSFTFVSTANAFVLRGTTPVFVDIREDTLNINEKLIEQAITKRTKAIMVVHYAGVPCEMDTINAIAKKHKLLVFEDAAQALLSKYRGKQAGTLGDLGAFSFHETKNVISGEGGALIINNERFIERAEIIREKGTNRNKFLKGQVDKYTWVDIGSSYLPGELIAAFLYAQLKKSEKINDKRVAIWNYYYKELSDLEQKGLLRRPIIPNEVTHNGHMFYILVETQIVRTKLIDYLSKAGINTVFHYVPLHSSPAGIKFTRFVGDMQITNGYSSRLVRLPLFYDMTLHQAQRVVVCLKNFFSHS